MQKVTSSWFFLSTLNYDARSTTHQTGSLSLLFKSRNCSGRLTHFPWVWYVHSVLEKRVKLFLMLTWN